MSMSEQGPSIAILASGGGSTAEAFIHATLDGRVDAEVGLVVCNKRTTVRFLIYLRCQVMVLYNRKNGT